MISDKISAAMLYIPRLLLHVSRPVRWDSDHVVLSALQPETVAARFAGDTEEGATEDA